MKKFAILILAAAATCGCGNPVAESVLDMLYPETFTRAVSATAHEISVDNLISLSLSDELAPGQIHIVTKRSIYEDYLTITDREDELTIRKKTTGVAVEVIVSSKQYNSIKASGACQIGTTGDAAEFDSFELDLEGASQFIGSVEADSNIDIELSGASLANITGSAANCNVELEGLSMFIGGFECRRLDVDLSGASSVAISVSESIEGSLRGGSSIKYNGTPTIDVDTEGGSTVEPITE